MVNPLNNSEDLKSRLSFLGPNQEQFELEERLQDATLEMDSLVGRTVEEQLVPTHQEQTDFRFAFSNIHKLIRVEIVTNTFDEEVDASNYTETLDPTRADPTNISFDQTWAEDNLFNNDYRLRAIYIPEIFKRLELRLAELDIARLAAVQTGDEERKAQAEQAKERMMNIVENINRTTQNLNDKDAGDTLAANYNFPGDTV